LWALVGWLLNDKTWQKGVEEYMRNGLWERIGKGTGMDGVVVNRKKAKKEKKSYDDHDECFAIRASSFLLYC